MLVRLGWTGKRSASEALDVSVSVFVLQAQRKRSAHGCLEASAPLTTVLRHVLPSPLDGGEAQAARRAGRAEDADARRSSQAFPKLFTGAQDPMGHRYGIAVGVHFRTG